MGFLIHGVEYGPDGKITGFPSYYLETDDQSAAVAEALRRGTGRITCTPAPCCPAGYDAVTGYPVADRWPRLSLWLADLRSILKVVCYLLLFVGVTAAILFILLVYFLGVDTRSPFERQRHKQQTHDIYRGE